MTRGGATYDLTHPVPPFPTGKGGRTMQSAAGGDVPCFINPIGNLTGLLRAAKMQYPAGKLAIIDLHRIFRRVRHDQDW